jgi:uncharacterized protein
MKFMRLGACIALVFTISACKSTAPTAAGDAPIESSTSNLAQDVVTVTASNGKVHSFNVEVARTEAEQKRGLSFRDTLDPDRGMIFPLVPQRTASFWMKDTLISLDIIYIRNDGTIESIAADMVPQSQAPRSSNEPVAAVLELKGGEAARRGIEPGNRINWTGMPR